MTMVDSHKILAVAIDDPEFNSFHEASELPMHRLTMLRRFFQDYKQLEGKQVEVDDFQPAAFAMPIIEDALNRYSVHRRQGFRGRSSARFDLSGATAGLPAVLVGERLSIDVEELRPKGPTCDSPGRIGLGNSTQEAPSPEGVSCPRDRPHAEMNSAPLRGLFHAPLPTLASPRAVTGRPIGPQWGAVVRTPMGLSTAISAAEANRSSGRFISVRQASMMGRHSFPPAWKLNGLAGDHAGQHLGYVASCVRRPAIAVSRTEAPRPQTSVRGEICPARIDLFRGHERRRSRQQPRRRASSARRMASPKSVTHTTFCVSSRRFPGFRSQWMMPLAHGRIARSAWPPRSTRPLARWQWIDAE